MYLHCPDMPSDMQIHGVPHPKTKTTVQIGIFDGTLHEIQRVKKANSSWFIDETVEKCGYLYITTPMDPLLFLTCTVVDKLEGKWRTLPDILEDYKVLKPLVTHEMLRTICSHQDIDDEMLYRLDEARLLAWLRLKAKKLFALQTLQQRYTFTAPEGADEAAILQMKSQMEKNVQAIAIGLVAEHIPKEWHEKLAKSFGLETATPGHREATTHAQRDPRNQGVKRKLEEEAEAKKKAANASLKSKQLQKVDKKGMKTLACFFSKK
jgi:hypothetical protein